MKQVIKELNQVNWDFSDYYSTKYPLEISSLPWYLATYPAPLAKFLIGLLSEERDVVLDPFGGSGTTCYEAIKLNRCFVYNDLNPYAADIVSQLMGALLLGLYNSNEIHNILFEDQEYLLRKVNFIDESEYTSADIEKFKEYLPETELIQRNISLEAYKWYHVKTLKEMLVIFDLIDNSKDEKTRQLRKFAFVNKLKDFSSQRNHYTYVTDNCKPRTLRYYRAFDLYLEMLERVIYSINELINNYTVINDENLLPRVINESKIHVGDARNLGWIQNESIDFVLTSPPYVCSQDYIKTMRLVNIFYIRDDFSNLSGKEIGPRVKRKGKPDKVIGEFYQDMDLVIREIFRVLKKNKYFCLVVGQGKSKITTGYDTVNDLKEYILSQYTFEFIYEKARLIGHKAQRIGGVSEETILVFKKN